MLGTGTEIDGAFDEGERSGGVEVASSSVTGLLEGVCWRKAFSDIGKNSGSRDDKGDGPRVKGVATVVRFWAISNEQTTNDEILVRDNSIYLLCVASSLLSPIKAKRLLAFRRR